jgi:hypothetical protein
MSLLVLWRQRPSGTPPPEPQPEPTDIFVGAIGNAPRPDVMRLATELLQREEEEMVTIMVAVVQFIEASR